MPDFLFLMHRDAEKFEDGNRDPGWGPYLAMLRASGSFQGGSAIGPGTYARKSGSALPVTSHLAGFIRVGARDLDEARTLLDGNPVFESGGTVEIRELPLTDRAFETRLAQKQIGDVAVENEKLFQDKSLNASIIRGCSMTRSTFDDVDLSETAFTNVSLRGAKFENVNLAGVAINDANIDGLTIFGHNIQILIRAELARSKT